MFLPFTIGKLFPPTLWTLFVLSLLTLTACFNQDAVPKQPITPKENRVAQNFSVIEGRWQGSRVKLTDGKEVKRLIVIQHNLEWFLIGYREADGRTEHMIAYFCKLKTDSKNAVAKNTIELMASNGRDKTKWDVEYYRDGDLLSLECSKPLHGREEMGDVDITGQWTKTNW